MGVFLLWFCIILNFNEYCGPMLNSNSNSNSGNRRLIPGEAAGRGVPCGRGGGAQGLQLAAS
jgi:hypothetical protein